MPLISALTLAAGMILAFWLALYLLPRGFDNPPTRRAIITLLAFAAAAFLSFYNLYHPVTGLGAWWSLLLTISLLGWYDLVFHYLPAQRTARVRWAYRAVMGLGLTKIILLALNYVRFPGETGASLWIVAGRADAVALVDAVFLLFTAVSLLDNFRAAMRSGRWPRLRSLWTASWLAAAGLAYGAMALLSPTPLWRLPMDLLLTVGIAALGYGVAQHQALVLRRSVLREMPVTGLTTLGLTSVYVLFAWARDFTPSELGALTMLAVLTHSLFDLVREAFDRWLYRRESRVRQQLRTLAQTMNSHDSLQAALQTGLESLCEVLGARGGFVAVRRETDFEVMVALNALTVGQRLPAAEAITNDLHAPTGALAVTTAWLAPVVASAAQIAVIGLGPRRNGSPYHEVDLDWLDEMADWAGRLLARQHLQPDNHAQVEALAEAATQSVDRLRRESDELLEAFDQPPAPDFIKHVEQGLRHLADYPYLSASPLAATLGASGVSHLERGKAVREALLQAVEALRPAGPRPSGVLPREWHAYAILHDAYVADVPNREIMARLYVSEGTFNRQRRRALMAVARTLSEVGRD